MNYGLPVNSLKKVFLDLLFPAACLGCESEGEFLCQKCANSLYMIPPACFVCKKLVPGFGRITPGRTCESCRKNSRIYAFFSPFLFKEKLVHDLIRGLKYARIKSLAADLGFLLSRYVNKFNIIFPEELLAVAVPLHKRRKRTRGFNQSELILRSFVESADLSPVLAPHALARAKNTIPQVELSGHERRRNVKGVFKVIRPESVRGRNILLLDDVSTTGATLEEAARALKEAGAKEVWAMTVAH